MLGENFEQVFKRRLKENGYTQVSLAKRLHVTPSAVNRWIKGPNTIPYETVKTLSDLWKLNREEKAAFCRVAAYPLPPEYSDIHPRPSSTVEALSPYYF